MPLVVERIDQGPGPGMDHGLRGLVGQPHDQGAQHRHPQAPGRLPLGRAPGAEAEAVVEVQAGEEPAAQLRRGGPQTPLSAPAPDRGPEAHARRASRPGRDRGESRSGPGPPRRARDPVPARAAAGSGSSATRPGGRPGPPRAARRSPVGSGAAASRPGTRAGRASSRLSGGGQRHGRPDPARAADLQISEEVDLEIPLPCVRHVPALYHAVSHAHAHGPPTPRVGKEASNERFRSSKVQD